jgi:xanthine dehydrogenase small subunit
VTIEDLRRDRAFCDLVPIAPEVIDRFASTIIRNRATVAGNLVNASPIGDLSVLLLALDAEVILKSGAALAGAGSSGAERAVPLRDFHLGYKKLAMQPGEVMTAVRVPLSIRGDHVSFEKISQRRHLDIASVNSAARFTMQDDGTIASVTLSVGGVAPVPLLARKTMAFLLGRRLDADTVRQAAGVLLGEIAPIDDVRGSAAYKRELARRSLFAHALRIAPDRVRFEELS